jgi:hypothetical protein
MEPEVLQKMISEYRKRVELYQSMIAEWEKELGVATSETPAAPSSSQNSAKRKEQLTDILNFVREWQFFNQSQPEAAKAVLEIVGHPLTTQQIVDAIEKGGVKVGGKTPKDKKQNFYTILQRSSEIGRAAKDTWGLLSWPGITKTQGKDDDVEDNKKTKEQSPKQEN